jgi:WG containing repeat
MSIDKLSPQFVLRIGKWPLKPGEVVVSYGAGLWKWAFGLLLMTALIAGCGVGLKREVRVGVGSAARLWYQLEGRVFAMDVLTRSVLDLGEMTYINGSRSFKIYERNEESLIFSVEGVKIYQGVQADVWLPYQGFHIYIKTKERGFFLDSSSGTISESALESVFGAEGDYAIGYMGNQLVTYHIPSRVVRAVIQDSPEAWPIQHGRIAVRRTGRWGFVDLDGVEIVPCKYRAVRHFSEGIASVQMDDLTWQYIKTSGEIVTTPPLEDVGDFSEGVATCSYRGVHHLMDSSGRMVPADGDGSELSNSGLIVAQLNQEGLQAPKEGYIGHDGRWRIPPVYDECYSFVGDLAVVRADGELWLIDRSGNRIGSPPGVPLRSNRKR